MAISQIKFNPYFAPLADNDFNFAVKDLPPVYHTRPVIINRSPFTVGIGLTVLSNKKFKLYGDIRYLVRNINYLDNHLISLNFFYNTIEISGQVNTEVARFTNNSIMVYLGAGANKVVTPSSNSAWREEQLFGGYTYEFRLDSEPVPSYFLRLGGDFQVDFSTAKALTLGLGFQYQHTPTFFVEEEIIGLRRVARSNGIRPHYLFLKIGYLFQFRTKNRISEGPAG